MHVMNRLSKKRSKDIALQDNREPVRGGECYVL
jgi:hypothetical protein